VPLSGFHFDLRDLASPSTNGSLAEFPARPHPPLPSPNEWLIWQLADSAFPAGGFAHSNGLEAAWQHGEVRDSQGLTRFCEASLWQFGHASLPFMLATHRNPERICEVNKLFDCFTTNHIANRASRVQGQSFLASARRIFPVLNAQLDRLETGSSHLSPILGIVLRALTIDCPTASRLLIFFHLRSLASSAVRLGIVGPMEAQRLQHSLSPLLDAVLSRCADLTLEDISQPSPLLEIWQSAHDRLYSRLFQS
jgi:urease accessory protein